MAFSNIENSEKLEIIDIAIVDNDEFNKNQMYKETFKTLSDEKNEDRLFNTKYVTEEKAKEMLENEEIIGYLILKNEPQIVVKASGINETIFKEVVEEINQTKEIINNLTKEYLKTMPPHKLENLYKEIYEKALEAKEANIENISNKNLSYTMIEFYTLIAMTCLYGGILGMTSINKAMPNMSSTGKRIAVSPTQKGKIILSSSIASYIVELIGITLLFVYTIFVLKIDYGENLRTYSTFSVSADALQDYHLVYV